MKSDLQYLRDTGGCDYLQVFINGELLMSTEFSKEFLNVMHEMKDDCKKITGVSAISTEKCIIVSAWVEDTASFKRFIDEKFSR